MDAFQLGINAAAEALQKQEVRRLSEGQFVQSFLESQYNAQLARAKMAFDWKALIEGHLQQERLLEKQEESEKRLLEMQHTLALDLHKIQAIAALEQARIAAQYDLQNRIFTAERDKELALAQIGAQAELQSQQIEAQRGLKEFEIGAIQEEGRLNRESAAKIGKMESRRAILAEIITQERVMVENLLAAGYSREEAIPAARDFVRGNLDYLNILEGGELPKPKIESRTGAFPQPELTSPGGGQFSGRVVPGGLGTLGGAIPPKLNPAAQLKAREVATKEREVVLKELAAPDEYLAAALTNVTGLTDAYERGLHYLFNNEKEGSERWSPNSLETRLTLMRGDENLRAEWKKRTGQTYSEAAYTAGYWKAAQAVQMLGQLDDQVELGTLNEAVGARQRIALLQQVLPYLPDNGQSLNHLATIRAAREAAKTRMISGMHGAAFPDPDFGTLGWNNSNQWYGGRPSPAEDLPGEDLLTPQERAELTQDEKAQVILIRQINHPDSRVRYNTAVDHILAELSQDERWEYEKNGLFNQLPFLQGAPGLIADIGAGAVGGPLGLGAAMAARPIGAAQAVGQQEGGPMALNAPPFPLSLFPLQHGTEQVAEGGVQRNAYLLARIAYKEATGGELTEQEFLAQTNRASTSGTRKFYENLERDYGPFRAKLAASVNAQMAQTTTISNSWAWGGGATRNPEVPGAVGTAGGAAVGYGIGWAIRGAVSLAGRTGWGQRLASRIERALTPSSTRVISTDPSRAPNLLQPEPQPLLFWQPWTEAGREAIRRTANTLGPEERARALGVSRPTDITSPGSPAAAQEIGGGVSRIVPKGTEILPPGIRRVGDAVETLPAARPLPGNVQVISEPLPHRVGGTGIEAASRIIPPLRPDEASGTIQPIFNEPLRALPPYLQSAPTATLGRVLPPEVGRHIPAHQFPQAPPLAPTGRLGQLKVAPEPIKLPPGTPKRFTPENLPKELGVPEPRVIPGRLELPQVKPGRPTTPPRRIPAPREPIRLPESGPPPVPESVRQIMSERGITEKVTAALSSKTPVGSLAALGKQELRWIARELGVSTGGTVKDLATRIVNNPQMRSLIPLPKVGPSAAQAAGRKVAESSAKFIGDITRRSAPKSVPTPEVAQFGRQIQALERSLESGGPPHKILAQAQKLMSDPRRDAEPDFVARLLHLITKTTRGVEDLPEGGGFPFLGF